MLAKMIYGVVCFATLLSFVGTVLGGIWADQSWGRFWGWDPKENGALLDRDLERPDPARPLGRHGQAARHGACWRSSATSSRRWSWFGTNMLGVGLHSYGFMAAALFWLLVFAGSQLALICLGWIPQRHWLSFAKPQTDLPPSARETTSASRGHETGLTLSA